MSKSGFMNAEEGPEIVTTVFTGSGKAREFQKTPTSVPSTMQKPWLCDYNKLQKSIKRITDHLTCLLRKPAWDFRSTKNPMEKTTAKDWEKNKHEGAYLQSPVCLLNTMRKCQLDKKSYKLNQDRQEKYHQLQICGWYHLIKRKPRGTK